jgi:hypothetical protein
MSSKDPQQQTANYISCTSIQNQTYIALSTAAWIIPYNHIHLQSFELRNVVHYRTGLIYVTHFYLEANRQNLLKDNNTKEKLLIVNTY